MPESINPEVLRTAREVAEHGADIKHLQSDMDRLSADMEEVKKTLAEINQTLSEAKGGWHMLMVVGGAGAAVGAGISWVFDLVRHNG